MAHKIEGSQVLVSFNPDSQELSDSGKTYILASSRGFVWTADGLGVSYNIVKRK